MSADLTPGAVEAAKAHRRALLAQYKRDGELGKRQETPCQPCSIVVEEYFDASALTPV